MQRRTFIQHSLAGVALLTSGNFPLDALADPEIIKLTILHTNDVHSRIDPFPLDGSRNEGKGGAARRANLIQRIRSEEEHVLLFDAGDIFQGTPYFNYFNGELEFKLMSAMKYDAATIGNHDFDGGIDGLYKQLPNANFPLLISNYDFSDTIMNGQTKEYKIFKRGKIKVGVFGVGIELEGLVPETLYKNTRYMDPVSSANRVASKLKNDYKCDYIICLSHLGYKYRGEKVSDMVLAEQTRHIDLIIGGHTHTFLDKPTLTKNLDGEAVVVNQAGWAGILLGRIDVYFERGKKRQCVSCKNIEIS
ncbi:MAG: metallophosphatase [Bacteroidota bacterium]